MQQLSQRIFLSGGLHVDVTAAARLRAEREKAVQEAKDSLAEIDSIGVQVNDLQQGRTALPLLNGRKARPALLETGEPAIAHWHTEAEGFAGRKPLDSRFGKSDRPEVRMLAAAAGSHAKAPVIHSRFKHLPRHRRRKHSVGFSGESLLNLNRIPCQVGRRCPKTGRSHFRINVRTAWHRLAILPIRHRRFAHPVPRQRLLVSAASHPNWPENDVVHQLGEGLACHILQQKLRDDKPTPGIPPIGSLSTRIAGVLAGFSPFSTCTTVGRAEPEA